MKKARAAVALLLAAVGAVVLRPAPAGAAPVLDPLDGTTVAVESMSPGRIDLFTRGADDALHQKTFVNGAWTGWNDLGGTLASAPAAVSMTSGRIDVFARSATNTLIQKFFANGVWSGWVDLGGTLTSAPAASSWGSNRIDVFARGGDNSIWQKSYVLGGSGWSAWADLAGTSTSAPAAVSWAANHIALFTRGSDRGLWMKSFSGGAWSGWSNVGLTGAVTSAPSVVSAESNHLDVFVQTPGNILQHRVQRSGTWRAWQELGAGTYSAPAATMKSTTTIDVHSVGAAGELQQKTFSTTWQTDWTRLGEFDRSLPTPRAARTVAFQGNAAGSMLDPVVYAYVGNAGRVHIGQQLDPDRPTSVQWSVLTGNEALTGEPAINEQADSRLQIAAQHTSGDVWTYTQANAAQPAFGPLADAGGWMAAGPAYGKYADGRLALFAVGTEGELFARTQAAGGGAYGNWINLGAIGASAPPVVLTGRTGLTVIAPTGAGALKAAELSATGAISAWTTISDGPVSAPAAVINPGFRARVVVRAADGSVLTKYQNADLTWPSAWETVGGLTAAGAPAIIIDPVLSVTAIVARGTDNEVYRVFETGQATGAWGSWERLNTQVSDPAATDPTVAPITTSTGQSWLVVYRNAADAHRVYQRELPNAARKATAGGPVFTGRTLPTPQDD